MRIISFKNSTKPIGLYSLNEGEKFVKLRLLELPVYSVPKYSIAQIQDCRQ